MEENTFFTSLTTTWDQSTFGRKDTRCDSCHNWSWEWLPLHGSWGKFRGIECWASVGRGCRQEGWAKSEDCSKGCWENPLRGRKSIRVARGDSSALLLEALGPGFLLPLPRSERPPERNGELGTVAPSRAHPRAAAQGWGAPWTLADLHCYSQRVQGTEALEGIGSDLCNLVVAQVSAKCAGGEMAESCGSHHAPPPRCHGRAD